MFKPSVILVAGLLAAGLAMADSTVQRSHFKAQRMHETTVMRLINGELATATFCDNFGYLWTMSNVGRDGREIGLEGTAEFAGFPGPAAGTLTLARGLPTDVTGTVDPKAGFCNQFHQVVVKWDRAQGLFVGTAYAFGGCEGEGATQIGRC